MTRKTVITNIVIAFVIVLVLGVIAYTRIPPGTFGGSGYEHYRVLNQGKHETENYEIVKFANNKETFKGEPTFFVHGDVYEDLSSGGLKVCIQHGLDLPTIVKVWTIKENGKSIQSRDLDVRGDPAAEFPDQTPIRGESSFNPKTPMTTEHFKGINRHSRGFLDFNNNSWKGWSGFAFLTMSHRGETFQFKSYARHYSDNKRVDPDLEFYYPKDSDQDFVIIHVQKFDRAYQRSWDTAGWYVLRKK